MTCGISAYSGASETLFIIQKCGILWHNSEQEKESIICHQMGYKNQSLAIIICHHSVSLAMPNGDPLKNFYITLHSLYSEHLGSEVTRPE